MRRFRPALLIALSLGLAAAPFARAQAKAWPKPVATFLDPAAPALRAALPQPPAAGSLAAQSDLETVLQVQAWRTPDQVALAQRLVLEDPFSFAEVLGDRFNGQNYPRTADLLKTVLTDSYAVSLTLKDVFTRKRPHLEDPRVKPCVELSTSPSYPSGHATRAYLTATLLAGLFPERREALLGFARKAAWARVQGGIHYPTDLEGGRLLAAALFTELNKSEAFRQRLGACAAEIVAQVPKAVADGPAAGTAELGGRKIKYTVQGAGPETLVLIHGWTCDGGFWSANLPALAGRYRVIALDLPGHGRSDACATCSMDEFGDAVFAVMDAAGVPRATLVGHSMGGAVMLAAVRRQPERVKAIVAVDAAFLEAEAARKFKDHADRFSGPKGLEAREQMVRSMFTTNTPKAVQEQVLKAMLGTPESVAVAAMRSMFSPAFWKEGTVDVPFLQIAAGTSTWISEEALRRRFPQAHLKRIEGTGHFLMMERPDAFNRMLLDWLEGLKP